jgi:hypothetical protein
MFDAPPINDGANLFIWIFVLGLGFVLALGLTDSMRENEKNKKPGEEH